MFLMRSHSERAKRGRIFFFDLQAPSQPNGCPAQPKARSASQQIGYPGPCQQGTLGPDKKLGSSFETFLAIAEGYRTLCLFPCPTPPFGQSGARAIIIHPSARSRLPSAARDPTGSARRG